MKAAIFSTLCLLFVSGVFGDKKIFGKNAEITTDPESVVISYNWTTVAPSIFKCNVDFEVVKDFDAYSLDMVAILTPDSTKIPAVLFNQTIDVCEFFKSFNGQNVFAKQIYESIKKSTSMPLECPVKKGHYIARNYILDFTILPSFLFVTDAKAQITARFWHKVEGKKKVTVNVKMTGEIREAA